MNFDFIKPYQDFNKLYKHCSDAESFVLSNPDTSVVCARKAIEFIVRFIYKSAIDDQNDSELLLFDMLIDERFVNYIDDSTIINSLHSIRKMGNIGAHGGDISKDDAMRILEELHYLTGEIFIILGLIDDYPLFLMPSEGDSSSATKTASINEVKETKKDKVTVEPELIAKFAPKMRETKFNTKHKRNEEENKKLYLYASLREAGWPVVNTQNHAVPSSAGIQMLLDDGDKVDYVLYGKDNRPLAIVDYSTTVQNIVEGRKKVIKQAEAMSVKYGYKPIAYYTEGYHIYVIDQLGYAPRRVFQFHSIEELELLKLRAGMREDISNPQIDENITNRQYQKDAIKAACGALMKNRRRSLLVMATGTGKTRVSISLVDVLMKAGWIKNVLFLADRTSLVKQAHKNFNKLLPNVTTSVYSGGSTDRDANARIIFSTYQTMINLVNDETREFGIGRFDLIIIDEAHRSIFNKYGALFNYFDSLMIGLTATPSSMECKNTYDVFGLKKGEPDYAYELEQAIDDGYLVGFSILDKTTEKLKRGICYDDLSDEEKQSIEDSFSFNSNDDTDFSGTVIDPQMMQSRNVINLGTINAMLNDLMQNGLKIDNGDSLGKTIIFASSHVEAEKIVERFQALYPYYGMDYCKLIDSKVSDSQNLIERFGERNKLPQIAVSVDMMDTGIDVPDVLNLVFFKSVKSKIKFLQMIGRGTRLSPDVFGPSIDKQGFVIFDYYDNFNYFSTGNTWSTVNAVDEGLGTKAKSQSLRINELKFDILCGLVGKSDINKYEATYRDSLRAYFIKTMNELCNDDIEVQYNMAYVSKYRTAEQWNSFPEEKIKEIRTHILPLFPPIPGNPKIKTFDLIMYGMGCAAVTHTASGARLDNRFERLDSMLYELTKLKTIPEVVKKEELINKLRNDDYLFKNFSLERCEMVRTELRVLMQYIPDRKEYYIIDIDDDWVDKTTGDDIIKKKPYADRVAEYIENGSPILAKIRNLDRLTDEEKTELETTFKVTLGSAAEYAAWLNNKPFLPFLRIQVGIAEEAVDIKFGSFLNDSVLDEQQLELMRQIIEYVKENGDITTYELQSVSPFCDIDIFELFGDGKMNYVKELIDGLHKPVM